MWILVATAAAVCIVTALAPAAGAATPTLRMVPGAPLAVEGTGFVPRTTVRLRLTSSGRLQRVVVVRTGVQGGFRRRLPEPQTCSLTVVTATGAGGRQARLPMTWFVRRCAPPPPIDPAPSS
jgi:hypothetical protein